MGATFAGRPAGYLGDAGCLSFFPSKNLGAYGDGGAVLTNDPSLHERMAMIANHGSKRKYHNEMVGINSRLDAIQAAVLRVKLQHLDAWNAQRQIVAQRYTNLLQPLPGLALPQTPAQGKAVWNQYTIRLLDSTSSSTAEQPNFRDRVRQSLQDQGVSSMIYYPLPLHLQPVYRNLGYQPGSLPVTEQVAHQVLSLPMFPELTPEEQEQVVYALKTSL